MILRLEIDVKGNHSKLEGSNLTPVEDLDTYQVDCAKALELMEAWITGFRAATQPKK